METTESSYSTRALWVAKLTVAPRTPASFLRVRSLRAAQEAQCIPVILNVAVVMIVLRTLLSGDLMALCVVSQCNGLAVRVRDHRDFCAPGHHAHGAIEPDIASRLGREGNDRGLVRG